MGKSLENRKLYMELHGKYVNYCEFFYAMQLGGWNEANGFSIGLSAQHPPRATPRNLAWLHAKQPRQGGTSWNIYDKSIHISIHICIDLLFIFLRGVLASLHIGDQNWKTHPSIEPSTTFVLGEFFR